MGTQTIEAMDSTERLLSLFLAIEAAHGDERDRLVDEYERSCRDWVLTEA